MSTINAMLTSDTSVLHLRVYLFSTFHLPPYLQQTEEEIKTGGGGGHNSVVTKNSLDEMSLVVSRCP